MACREVAAKGGAKHDNVALMEAVRLAKTDLTTELSERVHGTAGHYRRTILRGRRDWASAWRWRSMISTFRPRRRMRFRLLWKGSCLAFADRIQTIVRDVRHWQCSRRDRRIHLRLRRAANAIVKILAESDLPLKLSDVWRTLRRRLIRVASFVYRETLMLSRQCLAFLRERLALLFEGCTRVCL